MRMPKYKSVIKKVIATGLCAGLVLGNISGFVFAKPAETEDFTDSKQIADNHWITDYGQITDNNQITSRVAEDFYLHGSGKDIVEREPAGVVDNAGKNEVKLKICNSNADVYSHTTSDEGLVLIKAFEGCRLQAYKAISTEAYYTIGYGHYGPDVEENMVITQEEADALFRVDLQVFEGYVNDFLNDYSITVTQNQFDALVSFTYNCGPTWATNYSTIRNYLLAGIANYSDDQIINAFSLWNTSGGIVLPGLTVRRRKEAAFFLGDESLADYKTGQYTVAPASLAVRTGPGTTYAKATIDGQDISLLKNDVVSIAEVQKVAGHTWGKYDQGWIMMDYCRFVVGSETNPSNSQSESSGAETNPGQGIVTSQGTETNPGQGAVTAPGEGTAITQGTEMDPGQGTVAMPGEGTEASQGEETNPEQGTATVPGTVTETKTDPEEAPLEQQEEDYPIGFYQVTSSLNIRAGAGTDFGIVGLAREGNLYRITQTSGRWGKCAAGWISLKYCVVFKPDRPVISSKVNEADGIKISWSEVPFAEGYFIYKKNKDGKWEKIKTIKSGKTTNYTDTAAIENNCAYQYKVFSYCKIDGVVCKSTGSSIKTMIRITGSSILSVQSSVSKNMTVKWEKGEDTDGYKIQYSTNGNFSREKTKTLEIKKNETVSGKISGLVSGTKYYVRVRTYKEVGGKNYYSAWSKVGSAVVR